MTPNQSKYEFSDEKGRQRAITLIGSLPLDGRRWVLTWRMVTEKRRTAQNSLLWRWNGIIQSHMRETFGEIASAEDWHEILCERLMPADPVSVKLPDGTKHTAGRWRSSKASVREMSEYLNLLDQYCAEHLGLLLPHSGDEYHEAMSARVQ